MELFDSEYSNSYYTNMNYISDRIEALYSTPGAFDPSVLASSFRLGDDDRIAEIWFHNRDQAPVDEFWS